MYSTIRNKNKQKGMTGIGWIMVIGLIAFFAVVAIRTFPIFMEGFKVRAALASLQEQPGVTRKTKSEIVRLLFRRFDVDDITSITREDILIEKSNDVLTVTIDFEMRKHVMGNMDIVGVFNEEVEVIAN